MEWSRVLQAYVLCTSEMGNFRGKEIIEYFFFFFLVFCNGLQRVDASCRRNYHRCCKNILVFSESPLPLPNTLFIQNQYVHGYPFLL